MKDTTAYKIFHDIDFNEFPWSILKPVKTHIYPITSLFTVETPYAKFYLDDMVKVTNIDEYCLDDLRPDDVVMDIGACIGSFSLKVHNKVKRVYAFEPIMSHRLKNNIKLNNAWNIDVISWGIGEGYEIIKWAGYEKRVITLPLPSMIRRCGGQVDFLKLDCEGAEYCIKPEELKKIRRIEAEVHKTKNHDPNDFLITLYEAGFDYTYAKLTENTIVVHAHNKKM